MSKRNSKNIISVSMRMIATFIFVFALLSFSSCNAQFVSESKESYYAYIIEGFATDDSASGYVRIGFTADDATKNIMPNVEVKCEKFVKQTFWFTYSNYVYSVDGKAVESNVLGYVADFSGETDEEKEIAVRLKNVKSENLKVLYQYATIYKSTTSSGTVIKQNRNYIHTWEFGLGENVGVEIRLRNEIRASWYTVVIGAALVVLSVVVPLTIAASKKRKERKDEETTLDGVASNEEVDRTSNAENDNESTLK